ncbi:hypothetical protein ACFQ67_17595 [Streptomyces sp. NPDC056488]|uniref:hypothetical protein n=1 Tax=unclassified Streptomyces TaxID=2593676 RepID=UPI0036BC0FB7
MPAPSPAALPEERPGLPPRAPAWGFTDVFTRTLLRHRGPTTELLERRVRHRLRLRLVGQTLTGSASGARRLVRRTELVAPDGTVVSRNLVLGRLPRDEELASAVTSRSVPLGRSLAAYGVPQRRTPLTAGLAPWRGPGGGPSAVSRGYLLQLADEAPLYVRETFHPSVAPPERAP